jgi:NADP-dependent 3-hydroxy acid dehydrogenase YdfG
MRAELRGTGVRVTLISPGPVDTPLWDEVNPDEREGFTPRARMLRPEDVAAAVRFVVAQPATVNVDELRLSRA